MEKTLVSEVKEADSSLREELYTLKQKLSGLVLCCRDIWHLIYSSDDINVAKEKTQENQPSSSYGSISSTIEDCAELVAILQKELFAIEKSL